VRYKITEGVNRSNGKPIFYAYKCQGGDPELWSLLTGSSSMDDCRAYIERDRNPVPERTIEEFER
jgi:hypothetical protein